MLYYKVLVVKPATFWCVHVKSQSCRTLDAGSALALQKNCFVRVTYLPSIDGGAPQSHLFIMHNHWVMCKSNHNPEGDWMQDSRLDAYSAVGIVGTAKIILSGPLMFPLSDRGAPRILFLFMHTHWVMCKSNHNPIGSWMQVSRIDTHSVVSIARASIFCQGHLPFHWWRRSPIIICVLCIPIELCAIQVLTCISTVITLVHH